MSLRVGVLVSGRGTNLQAIIDAIERGELDARIVLVISNHRHAPALARAAAHGIPALAITFREYGSRREQQLAMLREFQARGAELIVTAGFDKILIPEFVQAYAGRIINIHPSLLPAFAGGMAPRPQAEALAAGVKIAGCTVHFVTADVDAGPIILQAAVPVEEDDTIETLAARILEQEHRILPRAIQLFAEGRLRIEGKRVRILPAPEPAGRTPA
jgi:phosphoribosylglycinamide formyltransferase-1